MDISNHAYERYCERFMGIVDKKEMKELINSDSKEQLRIAILNIYTKGCNIYTGRILDTDPVRNFYLSDNTILVLDEQANTIITLYKIDYGFPEATNLKVVNDLADLIKELQSKLESANMKIDGDIRFREAQLFRTEAQIQTAMEQLELLNTYRAGIINDIKNMQIQLDLIKHEIRSAAVKLVCSWEYKRDFSKDIRIR